MKTTKNNKNCPLSYFLFKLILYQFYIYFLIRKQTMSGNYESSEA